MSPSAMLAAWGLPGFEDEVKDLIPGRRYRFDCAHRELKIAVEIQGGVWMPKSGHSRLGRLRDMEKSNLVQLEGYWAFEFTPQQFKSGEAAKFLIIAARTRMEAIHPVV